MTDLSYLEEMNNAYLKLFPGNVPARAIMVIPALRVSGAKVQIEFFAFQNNKSGTTSILEKGLGPYAEPSGYAYSFFGKKVKLGSNYLLFVTAQSAEDTNSNVPNGFAEQVEAVFTNLKDVLTYVF
jgi:enamine deaminase RidA (YjgF/YER057c/UK114 family)